MPVALQYLIYGMAVVLLCGILLYPSPIFRQEGEGHHSHEHTGGKHMMMRSIAYGTLAAGALAYLMHMLNQPLLLGYLLGGNHETQVGNGKRKFTDQLERRMASVGKSCLHAG